jgi:hypothetical protein
MKLSAHHNLPAFRNHWDSRFASSNVCFVGLEIYYWLLMFAFPLTSRIYCDEPHTHDISTLGKQFKFSRLTLHARVSSL